MPIRSGAFIGILGGGQLARMLCQAAGDLGYNTAIFCPELSPPALSFATQYFKAEYSDTSALREFASMCDVITCEFENISARTLETLEQFGVVVRPNPRTFGIAQDRLTEKAFLQDIGVQTTEFVSVDNIAEAKASFALLGSGILKSRRLGYDGKGQHQVRNISDLEGIDYSLAKGGWIYEKFVDYSHEISVILARSPLGDTTTLPIPTNRHEGGILRTSEIPSALTSADTDARAIQYTKSLATSLDYFGVLALEFFVTPDGALLANEFAPRVHNSGHWSRELCSHDQFTLHILAITDWPLPVPAVLSAGVMHNIIGEEANTIWQNMPNQSRLTLYGKSPAKPGRKMGHYVVRGLDF